MGKTTSHDAANGSPSAKRQKTGVPPVIPSASSLTKRNLGSGNRRDRPDGEEGVLHLYAIPYCKNGSVYGSQFSTNEMLAVHFLYNGYPGLTFNFLGAIQLYVKHRHEEDNREPTTMDLFNAIYGVKVVVTSDNDVDHVGTFKQFRCVIYVDKAKEKELYLFLDSWVTWRKNNPMPSDPHFPETIPIVIHTANKNLEFTYDDSMENPLHHHQRGL